MQKIPTIFMRDLITHRVINEVNPDAAWVFTEPDDSWPTKKFDGTCCMIRDGKLYKRYEVKRGGTPPPDFESAGDIDENTGKQVGWLPVGDGPEDQYHREAFRNGLILEYTEWINGTYELCGPRIQGNPEHFMTHVLVKHGSSEFPYNTPRDFEGLKRFFSETDTEGIVWWNFDGRMAKIKAKDFGLKRYNG